MKTFLKKSLVWLGLAGAVLLANAADNPGQQVASKNTFGAPLFWLGTPPTETESTALLKALETLESGNLKGGFTAMEEFLAKNTNSAWAPSLRVNLAEYYREHGRYSLALLHWQQAWEAIKQSQDAEAQKLAVRCFAGWARLLASIGHKDQLAALFAELEQRQLPLGSYSPAIEGIHDGLLMMKSKPGASYRCGSYALANLASTLKMDAKIVQLLSRASSPDGGFFVSQLLPMAETNGLVLAAVRRPVGGQLIVPSVIHWKLNHYAAIVAEKDGRYKVADPTFRGHVWMDKETIDAEASGVFLVEKSKAPQNWPSISLDECGQIYGRGGENEHDDSDDEGPCESSNDPCDPPAANDGPGGGGGDDPCDNCLPPSDGGMPLWTISEPYATLWLQDTPLFYQCSDGQWSKLQLSYKHRGEDKGSAVGSFGPFWECNLLGFLEVTDSAPDVYVNHAGGGGKRRYDTIGTPDYKSQRRLLLLGVHPALVGNRGGQMKYGISAPVSISKTNHFLTQKVDRYGRTSYRNYETVGSMVRLTNVIDLDGKAMTFAYTNATFTNLITSATDPYGRVARFIYDSDGRLTNIVDMAGMCTSFKYDGNQRITEMVTPYGTNTFEYFSGTTISNYNGIVNTRRRAVRVTEPTGEKQLTAYCDFGPEGWRNSYHWNRAQYAAMSADGKTDVVNVSDADLDKAAMKNWAHGDGTVDGVAVTSGYTVSDTLLQLSLPKSVLGSRATTLFAYTSGQKRISQINKGSGWTVQIERNALGRPTKMSYYRGGQWADYTNNFDASGTILQTVYGPGGERLRAYGYDATNTNLLTSVTNALDEVIRYTHDATTLKVKSIILPSGLVRSNTYISSGTYQGFKAAEMTVGFATNYFAYENGLVKAQTNELGLVATYLYDNLNRLISTTYPDSTTVSNCYDKLDLIATKDRLNQWAYFGYNRLRQLVAETNVAGQVTTYDYCSCGSPSEITRWNGSIPLVTQISYDLAGNVTNVVYPDGYQKSYIYEGNNLVDKIKDSTDVEIQLYYTSLGDQHVVNYASIASSPFLQRQFDRDGRLSHVTGRNGITITNAYDVLGRLTNRATLDLSGYTSNTVSYAYTAAGLTNSTDELGDMTWFVYDDAGRLLRQTNANNEVLQFTYNPAGQMLTLKDGKNQQTSWNYDEYGLVTNKVDAASTVIFKYKYDQLDRLTNRWTVAKGDTFYKYDPIGNLTNVDYPGTIMDITMKYDALNRLTNVVDVIGTTKFGYTDGDLLTSEDGPWADDAISYAYNARRRSSLSVVQPNASPWAQTYTYDQYNRLIDIVSAAGNFIYEYWNSGISDRVMNLGLGGEIYYTDRTYINNEYDQLGRLTSTTLRKNGGTILNQHSYALNEGSQRTKQTFTGGNYVDYTYDDIGQLKTAKGTESDTTTARLNEQFGYAYDAVWNLERRTNNALTQTFSVDSKNQLTSATRSGTLTVAGLASEPRGGDSAWGSPPGVTNVSVSGTGLTTGDAALYADGAWAKTGATLTNGNNTYTATAKDTYNRTATDSVTLNLPTTVSFSYDGNGNLTGDGNRVFEYDYENQLTNVYVASAWRSEFKYDGFGRRRVRKEFQWDAGTSGWLLTNEVRYVYDGMLVVQERDANNLPQVNYTRGNDLSGSLQGAGGICGLLARTANSQLQLPSSAGSAHAYYHADGNGNITALVNTNGILLARYQYDPYGNLLGSSGPLAEANSYRFSSKEYQANAAIYYYGYRFYEPNMQRWLNRDPIKERGGLNLFQFNRNNPIRFIDFFGLAGMGDLHVSLQQPDWNFNDGSITDQSMDFLDAAMWADMLRVGCSAAKAGYNAIKSEIAAREALGIARERALQAALKRRDTAGTALSQAEEALKDATKRANAAVDGLSKAAEELGKDSAAAKAIEEAWRAAQKEAAEWAKAVEKARENWEKANEALKNCR